MTHLIAYTTLAILLAFALLQKTIKQFLKHKAQNNLCKLVFPQGEKQKRKVIEKLNNITNRRFNENDLLEYFLKMKSVQKIEAHDSCKLCVKYFLKHPPKIKLNRQEQVKFYKVFLNFNMDDPNDLFCINKNIRFSKISSHWSTKKALPQEPV